MTKQTQIASLMLFAGAASWFAPAAKADEWDKMTTMTFNEPVEIPGRVLPAGTYVFKLADSDSNRDIVQIFNQNQSEIFATILAIPDYRSKPADKTIVTFEERPSGAPEALHAWYYPGDTEGLAFIYPKQEHQTVARSEQAASTPSPTFASAPLPPAPALTAPQHDTDGLTPEVVNFEEVEEELVVAEQAPTAPGIDSSAVDSAPTPLPDQLPETAGNFLLFPLLGTALLGGGFSVIRFVASRS